MNSQLELFARCAHPAQVLPACPTTYGWDYIAKVVSIIFLWTGGAVLYQISISNKRLFIPLHNLLSRRRITKEKAANFADATIVFA